MPIKNKNIKRIGPGKFKVVSPTGSVHAKGTTYSKAKSQQRLLNAIDHGLKPTGKKRSRRYTKKRG